MSDSDTDAKPTFSLTRNGRPIASVPIGESAAQQPELPAVSELQPIGFSVELREPDTEYAIWIGDVPLDSARADLSGAAAGRGTAFGSNVYWEDGLHFESTRGRVLVRLQRRPVGSANGWEACATLGVNAVPTKLGELRCEAMEEDVRRVAAGLIFDLVSKMLRGVRYADGLRTIAHRSSHLELRALRNLWLEIEGLLRRIDSSPELRIRRDVAHRSFSGTERLDPVGIARLAARGFDPRKVGSGHSMMIPTTVLGETTNTVEHQLILGFLRLLLVRVGECIQGAKGQVQRIEDERPLRDVAVTSGPTLYQSIDLPKLARLQEAIDLGRDLAAQLRQAMLLPVFRGVRPHLADPETPVFRHVESYHRVGRAMQRYLSSSLVVLEHGEQERLKDTSRIYEHWVFIQLADAFRSAGLECDDLQGLVRRLSRHRFTLDLDEEVVLQFRVDSQRVIRVRYEPWILPADAARRRGDALCRAGASGPAWAPDVLIEFLEVARSEGGQPEVVYAVVVDAKYSKDVQDHHWSRVSKYAEIRTVEQRRQVVRQVWLAHPGSGPGIRCRDAAVTWTTAGPDRPRDETIMGTLSLTPAEEVPRGGELSDDAATPATAREFALGLMRYMRFLPADASTAAAGFGALAGERIDASPL